MATEVYEKLHSEAAGGKEKTSVKEHELTIDHLKKRGAYGTTPLMQACLDGEFKKVEEFVKVMRAQIGLCNGAPHCIAMRRMRSNLKTNEVPVSRSFPLANIQSTASPRGP